MNKYFKIGFWVFCFSIGGLMYIAFSPAVDSMELKVGMLAAFLIASVLLIVGIYKLGKFKK